MLTDGWTHEDGSEGESGSEPVTVLQGSRPTRDKYKEISAHGYRGQKPEV